MAKGEVQRGRFVAEDDSEPQLIPGVTDEPELSDEEKAYFDFRESLKAGEEMPTLRVSKVPKTAVGNPMHAKLIYCFACPVDQYSFEELCEYVRDCYGGGLYRLMATRKGHRGTLFNQLLTIAEAIQRKPNMEGAPSQNGNVSQIMDSVATLINQSQERTEALLARVGVGAQAPQIDPMAMFEKFALAMGAMQKLMPAPPPASDFVTELSKLAAMKGLLGNLFGGGDEGGGGGAAETNFYDTINTTLKTIAPALAAGLKNGIPALAAPAQPAQPDPGPVTPQPGAPAATPTAAQVNLKKQVDILVMQAKGGQTPEDVAEMVLNMTPEARYAELYDFINRPTVVNEMVAVNAEVANHREFFDKLRAAILSELGPEETEPAQPTG